MKTREKVQFLQYVWPLSLTSCIGIVFGLVGLVTAWQAPIITKYRMLEMGGLVWDQVGSNAFIAALFGFGIGIPFAVIAFFEHRRSGSIKRVVIACSGLMMVWGIAWYLTGFTILDNLSSWDGGSVGSGFSSELGNTLRKVMIENESADEWLTVAILLFVSTSFIGSVVGRFLTSFFTVKNSQGNSRKNYPHLIPIILFIIFLLVFAIAKSPKQKNKGYNVIFISVDTLRADHLGSYGYKRSVSPNLDAFANENILFEDAFASSPWTLPSHATMLTGFTPPKHGAISINTKIREGTLLLSEVLRAKGYKTIGVVNTPLLSSEYGFDLGYNYYRHMPPEKFIAEDLVDEALAQIDDVKPFFLFLHLYDPHWPYAAPEKYLIVQGKEKFPVPDVQNNLAFMQVFSVLTNSNQRNVLIDLYDSEILYADAQLGRFFEQLKRRGLWDRSIIIVTSDHGEEFFERGFLGHGYSLYQEQLHVPLLVHLPERMNKGSFRVNETVGQVDFAPTICDLLEFDFPVKTDGRSFKCLVEKSCFGNWPENYLAHFGQEILGNGASYAYRESNMKLIDPVSTNKGPFNLAFPEGLYDLDKDPKELENILNNDANAADTYKKALGTYLRSYQKLKTETFQQSNDMRDNLKALGYIN